MHPAMSSRTRHDPGFTLVELLVVIIIIGILASIAVPVFLNQRRRAIETGMKTDLRMVAQLQETYYSDLQTYAPSVAVIEVALAPDLNLSPNNVVTVVNLSATAFCLRAQNPSAADDYFWDSDGGGLLDRGVPCA